MAQSVTGYSYDVLSRFFNEPFDGMEFIVKVPSHYIRTICEDSPGLRTDDAKLNYARKRVVEATLEAQNASKFKPKLKVVFDKQVKDDKDIRIIDAHPAFLYTLCAHEMYYKTYYDVDVQKGVINHPWPYPSKEEARQAEEKLGSPSKNNGPRNQLNESMVSGNSIKNAAKDVRNPSQVAVMNNKSPNEVSLAVPSICVRCLILCSW